MNPVSNYTVSWSKGDSEGQDSDISNSEKGEHVQTTYSILNVTKSQLGNYTVRVINQAIKSEPNEATFTVVLELGGKNNKVIYVYGTATFQHLHIISLGISRQIKGPRWQSGNTLASHLCGRGSIPVMAVSGKAGSCLPLVGSLQYRTLTNYMYWFPLPFQLPVVI